MKERIERMMEETAVEVGRQIDVEVIPEITRILENGFYELQKKIMESVGDIKNNPHPVFPVEYERQRIFSGIDLHRLVWRNDYLDGDKSKNIEGEWTTLDKISKLNVDKIRFFCIHSTRKPMMGDYKILNSIDHLDEILDLIY